MGYDQSFPQCPETTSQCNPGTSIVGVLHAQGETEAGELKNFSVQGMIDQSNHIQESPFCGQEQNGIPKRRRTSLVIAKCWAHNNCSVHTGYMNT